MGSNRRYGDRLGGDLDRRVEQLATRPQPISLTDRELDTDHARPHQPANPVRVRAWVRFPETPIHTVAWATAWTDRAVHIEWQDAEGRTMRAWVWASAVERISADE